MDIVLNFLKNYATAEPKIDRIKLFGSRARGDHRPRSDYDLAVSAPEMTNEEWARWKLELEEKVPSLCGLDLLWIEQINDQNLLAMIERDGVVVYEQN